MGKNTIKFYRKMKTESLKTLLNSYETMLYNTDILIEESKNNNNDYTELEKKLNDYDIDVSLIRMELNKRLWVDKEV